MKCRPRARCNTRRPFQTRRPSQSSPAFDTTTNTSSDKGTTRKFAKGSDRGTSAMRRRSRAAASAWVISASSLASNLIDISFAVSKDSRARCTTNLVLCFQRLVERISLSQFRPQLIRKLNAKVHGDFVLDSAWKSSGEGPLQSRQ